MLEPCEIRNITAVATEAYETEHVAGRRVRDLSVPYYT